jgi:ABC-type multidrug transport system fused ATPase/permease subunit
LAAQDQVGFWSGLRQLYRMLSPHRRWQFNLVLALTVAGALAELATIGAIIPFVSLLADPHRLGHAPLIATAFDAVGATTDRQRLIAAAGLFMILALVAGAVRLQLAWSSQEFVFRLGHDFAVDIQRRLLLQPYTFHIGQNTSTLVAALEKVGVLTFTVIQQVIQAGTAVFISLFIVGLLIVIDPFAAVAAAAGFALIYVLVSAFTRRRLAQNSEVMGSSYDERVKILQESLGGIRDVIIDGSQSVYLDAFRRVDDRFNAAKASTAFISAAPRFVIEGLGMILIAALAIAISAREGGFALALPILGALALGAQRLLPLLQQIYLGWSLAAGNESLLTQVLALLCLPVDEELAEAAEGEPLPFRDRIRVEHVNFAYASRRAPALEDVSFEIPRGRRVALIGKTGSGKSTLADLLMGLLEPGAGRITIDGVLLTRENRRSWQRSIAHVPQAIFLADASIARNIALGVPAKTIDLPRVREAGRKAQLDEFVDTLPEGYDTHVGERGIRLSGGQRQRLAIARAIYKQVLVLVLDEATSALDDETEAAVMHALDQLGEEGRTIIMIAHRMTTIARADIVVRLDNGRVVEIGSHSETIDGGPQLRVS